MKKSSLSRFASLSGLMVGGLLLGTAAHAQQQTRGPGWEFGADVIFQPSTNINFNGGSRASLDDDWGLSLVFGYRFNEKLELQFGLDWSDVDYDVVIQSAPPSTQTSFRGSGTLEAFTPRVKVNYNFLPGPITPYVSGGIGWSFIDTNIPSGRAENVCWWDPWWGYVCGTVQNTRTIDEFEYQVGLGVRWDVGTGISLRLGYEKHWLDYSQATSTPDFDQYKLGIVYRY